MDDAIANGESFLDQPFFQASMRDHLRWIDHRAELDSPFAAAARSFLGVSQPQIAVQ